MSRLIHSFTSYKFAVISLMGVSAFSASAFLMSTAHAEPSAGSLALSDLNTTLINQSPALQQEIKQALKAVKKDDVGCFAPVIYRPFYELNRARIAPFTCYFANNKYLTIQANTLAKLPDGKMIPFEQFLDRKTLPQGVSLEFELTSWKWTRARP